MKLEELQRLAEGATPGPWRTGLTDGWYIDGPGDHSSMHILAGRSSHPLVIVCASHALRARCDSLAENAAYIAAMSPDTAKKLIAVALAGVHAHAEMARWSGIASGEGFWDAMNTLGTALEELK